MAASVAPLTTTVMNAVADTHAGVASGINNAVSRTAGLLGIAVLGLVILHAFNYDLERRIAHLNLAPEARFALHEQRARLAGTELSAGLGDEARAALRQAIRESFVFGFRFVMAVAAGMGLAAALMSWLMIESNVLAGLGGVILGSQ